MGEWIERIRKAPPKRRGKPTQGDLNLQTAKARPVGTRVGRCCALPVITRQRRLRSQVDWIVGTLFVGCFCPSFQSRSVTGSRICTGCDELAHGVHSASGPQGPAGKKIWHLLILSCAYIQPEQKSGTLGQLSHGTPVEPEPIKSPHRRDPSSGSRANRGHPSSAHSPPDPLGRVRAPRGPHVPDPDAARLALLLAPIG